MEFQDCKFPIARCHHLTALQEVKHFRATVQETLLIGEAPWHKDLVNCISVIGRLAKPLELRQGSNYQVAPSALYSAVLSSAFPLAPVALLLLYISLLFEHLCLYY
jgi:hypothetical protein